MSDGKLILTEEEAREIEKQGFPEVGRFMKKAPYRKNVTWEFEAAGEWWVITGYSDECLEIKECRCNGQEDTHRIGYLHRDEGGPWYWGEDSTTMLHYGDCGEPQAIIDYITEHGVPE